MDSVFLEVGIGLAVVFVLTASVVDGVNEVITRMLNTRSKALWATLDGMLQERGHNRPAIGVPFIVRSAIPSWVGGDDLRPDSITSSLKGTVRTTMLLNSPSIKALDYVRKPSRRTKVWYIGGHTFAAAIREIARTKSSPSQDSLQVQIAGLADDWKGSPLGDYLAAVAEDIGEDADRFLDGVAAWFDEQMERLRLTYRRNVKWVLGIAGVLLALGLNIDAIRVASALWDDAQLRTAIASLSGDLDEDDLIFADCELDTEPEDEPPADRRLLCALDDLSTLEEAGLPILGDDWTWRSAWNDQSWGDEPAEWVLHGAGVLLTGGAVSLGGVFWWDFLHFLSGSRRPGGRRRIGS